MDSRKMTFSERLYRVLLSAYPPAFRDEYASEMLLVFCDMYREALDSQGRSGLLRFWGNIVFDFVKTVCIEQVNNWTEHGKGGFALAGKEHITMALQFTLDIAQRTDIGLKRVANEDNLVSVVPENQDLLQSKGALFVVSDGMGGHTHGDVASEMVVQQVKDYYYQNLQDDIPTSLRKAVERANESVYQASEQDKKQGASDLGMGATCVAAVVHGTQLYAANVGDSRVYVLQDGQLHQVTRDHSLVAQMVDRGEITAAEARTHEERNKLYRAIGLLDTEVDIFTGTVQEGDTLVLCTDGLNSVLEDDEVRAIVEQYSPDESVQHLIARANEEGGPDNVTAIVVRVSAAV